MPKDGERQSPQPVAPASEPDEFDRQTYLKEIRSELLKKLGLPAGTKPEQVMRLLAIKQHLKDLLN
jgi:hypothetical protein